MQEPEKNGTSKITSGHECGEQERARGEKEDKLCVDVEETMGKGSVRLKNRKNE